MENYLFLLILIPLVGYIVNLLVPQKNEKGLYQVAVFTVGLQFLIFIGFSAWWIANGAQLLHQEALLLYNADDSHFSIDFFLDINSFVYFLVSASITFLVLIFSRYYIHREKGYKRFFNNVLFFYMGLCLVIFAGNFETMFVGWEVIGITSFFLIAFYRDRYLPVKNALKVVSIYRIADVFLLFAIWICHHYFKTNINFVDLQNVNVLEEPYRLGIPLTFLVVALVKSAQFPFSTWLPRAMEGPTTSSAIFYGSLSVHIGVFLMIRTYPLWHDTMSFKIILIAFGITTSVICSFIAQVQSTVKTQIAYSSVAQIGLMFIEVALGWHTFALIHFSTNAFLRTYQLLVSPSVLSYQIHDQFFNFVKPQHKLSNNFMSRVKMGLYILSIKEWNLDTNMFRWLWSPLKWMGNHLAVVNNKTLFLVFAPFYAVGLYFVYHQSQLPSFLEPHMLSMAFAFIGLLMILRAFVKRKEAHRSWSLIVANQMYIALAVAYNEQFDLSQIHIYLSGIFVSAAIGYYCFYVLNKANESTLLDQFRGHSYEHPRLATLFLLACLGLAGFPVTPTFIGEDIILGHVHENQYFLSFLLALCLILDGLAVFRVYARLFLGPHEKGYHETAYRSS